MHPYQFWLQARSHAAVNCIGITCFPAQQTGTMLHGAARAILHLCAHVRICIEERRRPLWTGSWPAEILVQKRQKRSAQHFQAVAQILI